jgi:hypothetical protein
VVTGQGKIDVNSPIYKALQEQFARMKKDRQLPSFMGGKIVRGMGFADGGFVEATPPMGKPVGEPAHEKMDKASAWNPPEHVMADPSKVSADKVLDHAGQLLHLARTYEQAAANVPGSQYVAIHKQFLRHTKQQLELAAKQMETLLRALEDHDLAE